MKKLFGVALMAMSLTSSVFALTDEQRKEFDEIFNIRIKINEDYGKEGKLPKEMVEKEIASIKEEKAKIEEGGDEAIEKYLKDEKLSGALFQYLAGAFGFYYEGSFPESGQVGYNSFVATFGPQFWLPFGENSMHGGYIKIPVGIGFLGLKNSYSFAMPIAVEAGYRYGMFGGFGIGAGLRYTFNPQKNGINNMMDAYLAVNLYWGLFFQVGYTFLSTQDVSLGGQSFTIEPYKGQTKIGIGMRF